MSIGGMVATPYTFQCLAQSQRDQSPTFLVCFEVFEVLSSALRGRKVCPDEIQTGVFTCMALVIRGLHSTNLYQEYFILPVYMKVWEIQVPDSSRVKGRVITLGWGLPDYEMQDPNKLVTRPSLSWTISAISTSHSCPASPLGFVRLWSTHTHSTPSMAQPFILTSPSPPSQLVKCFH